MTSAADKAGNLRVLITEREVLMRALNIEATNEAVQKLQQAYSEDDARVDDDPEVRCHAQLTATRALSDRSPLWLVK